MTFPKVVKLPSHTVRISETQHAYAPTFQRRGYVAARLEVRHDPQTERWTVVLCSRTRRFLLDGFAAWLGSAFR